MNNLIDTKDKNTKINSNKNNNEVRQRNYGLDYLRFFSILMIFSFHYACTYSLFESPIYKHANGGWGCPGTTVFFVLSGYLLRNRYKEISNLKTFYVKRFLSIFPAFYIAFITCYLLNVIRSRNPFYAGNPLKLIFTILGTDNYMAFYHIPTYAVVGEWFTAIIVIVYLIYPLLSKFYNKSKIIYLSLVSIIYLSNAIFNICKIITKDSIIPDASVITGIFLFSVGMFLSDTLEKIKNTNLFILLSLIIILIIIFIKLPGFIPSIIINNFLGINLFIFMNLLFTRLASIDQFQKLNPLAYKLSSISYCIYISHHFILNNLFPILNDKINSTYMHILNFILQLLFTVIVSFVLNLITNKVIEILKFKASPKNNQNN